MAKKKTTLSTVVEIAGRVDPSLGKTLESVGKKLKGLAIGGAVVAGAAAATKAVAQFAAESVKAAAAYETAFAGASTLMTGTKEELQAISDEIIKTSNETGVAAAELSQSVYSALSAGIDQEDAVRFAGQSAKLAAAGFTDVDTALSAVVKTLNAYNLSSSETDRVQKVLMQTQNLGITTVGDLGANLAKVTPTAAQFGVNIEQVGASLAVMTAAGTETASATTNLNAMILELGKSGSKAQKNLAAAAKGTKYAGMSFGEMMEAGATLDEVLGILGTQAEKTGLSMADMFGSQTAGSAAAQLSQNAGKFVSSLEAMSTEADVVGEAYDKVSNTFEHQMQVLTNLGENAKISLGSKLLPIVTNLATQAIPIVEQAIDKLSPVIDQVVDAVTPVLDQILPQLLPMLTEDFLPTVVQIGGDLLAGLLPPLLQLLQTAMPGILQLLQALMPLINATIPVITLLAQVFSAGLGAAIERILPIVLSLIDILTNVMEFITNVFSGNWSAAWENVVGIFKGLFNGMMSWFENIINGGIDLINGLLGGVSRIASKVGIDVKLIPYVSLPKFAAGGFTDGLSIAGEAGTEAVISFDPAYRRQNVGYWMEAGSRLGLGDDAVSTAGRLVGMDGFSLGSLADGGITIIYDFSGFTWSPTIESSGTEKTDVLAELKDHELEFFDWLEEWCRVREEGRW